MPSRDARDDWRRFDAGTIPGKEKTPRLDRFLSSLPAAATGPAPALLDVGCGAGRLARRMHDAGFAVLGIDINPAAIQAARSLAVPAGAAGRRLEFAEADFAADDCLRLAGGPFDVAVCQLVISIIGGPRERRNLLRHVRENLRPGAAVFLSASGVSDTINPGYARLYAADFPLTGERHTYLSRDERGETLYATHHFTPEELTGLLAEAGFGGIGVETDKETSSRRPDEAAYFLYATCRAP